METLIVVVLVHLNLALAQSDQGSRFEVASVKISQKPPLGKMYGREDIQANPGSLNMHMVRFRTCIKWAYQVPEQYILGPDWLGAPGWMGGDVTRYDIVAKAAADTPVSELRLMLRTLLGDEFKLAAHRETKNMPGYSMTVAKRGSKLSASQDSSNSQPVVGAEAGSVVFKNMTIAEFAEWLAGPIRFPVLDQTSLAGRFDFKLDMAQYGFNEDDRQSAFASALQEQLGLKLTKVSVPSDMLVIDHVESVPVAHWRQP
jgi:uncharacterized protein (TIGR03435 family)